MNKLMNCLACISVLFFSSCMFNHKKVEGNGNIISEKRTANNVSKIRVEGSINVIIDNGLAGAKVEADENIIPYIITETDGDWLKIKVKDNVNLQSGKPVTVYLSTPSITRVEVAGSGDVIANGKFSSKDNMRFILAGSGNITIDVNAPEVENEIGGSGTIHISGETRSVKVTIAGSGNYDGPNLKAESANVSVAGSGDALVFADVSLKASIAGSGNIKYKGNAAIEKQVAGSGEVVKAE